MGAVKSGFKGTFGVLGALILIALLLIGCVVGCVGLTAGLAN